MSSIEIKGKERQMFFAYFHILGFKRSFQEGFINPRDLKSDVQDSASLVTITVKKVRAKLIK